jgi:hypothetical protein
MDHNLPAKADAGRDPVPPPDESPYESFDESFAAPKTLPGRARPDLLFMIGRVCYL